MSIILLKLLALLLIFLTGIFFGMYPARVKPTERGQRNLTLGNAFSAGIFLGAGLLHMLPDGVTNFSLAFGNMDFPFAMLICGAGFLLILVLEKGLLGGSEDVGAMSKGKSVYPYILLVVLSVHSVIAGTTLGLEGNLLGSFALFVAIIAHKGAAAFALGISLKQANFTKIHHRGIIAFFSGMAPLGVVIGIILGSVLTAKSAIAFESVFDSLAAGTFLYVAVLDVMDEVFEQPGDGWKKVILSLLGFALMALIAVYA